MAPGPQLVVLIHRIFGAEAVALFDLNLSRQDRMGEWEEGRKIWPSNAIFVMRQIECTTLLGATYLARGLRCSGRLGCERKSRSVGR